MSKTFYRFLCAVMKPVYAVIYPAKVDGLENIPQEGGFILCCNHISARDPFYLAVREKKRYFHFMAKAELFDSKLAGAVLRGLDAFPVDRGHSDLNAIRTSLALLKDGHGLGIFPQGTRSRDNARTPMLEGVSMIALRAGVPVIPAYIGGPYRLFRRTQVSFGPPVSFEGLGRRVDSETLSKATRRIEDAVWGLKR
ncbi:MAG: 1-acyl-sn-glycerol-3-phosphate acyltransferase [Clostridia bacterium]|nr:1-acyl-sn-glycerol-3-phosphate acyltransferase [Clostridia bacterium]